MKKQKIKDYLNKRGINYANFEYYITIDTTHITINRAEIIGNIVLKCMNLKHNLDLQGETLFIN